MCIRDALQDPRYNEGGKDKVMDNNNHKGLPVSAIRDYCAGEPIDRLSLFGEALQGEIRPNTDIGMLVDYAPGAGITYFDMAQQEIDLGAIIGQRVDLRTRPEISRYFRDLLADHTISVYERNSRN